MAFISKAASSAGKRRWRIVWHDATKGAGRAGRRYADCGSGNHQAAVDAAGLGPEERAALANGAINADLRARLLTAYKALERERRRDAARAGGPGNGPRYEEPLLPLLKGVLSDLEPEVRIREERGGRAGIAARTLRDYRQAVSRFESFLESRCGLEVRSGQLTGEVLRDYRKALTRDRTRAGQPASEVTVNRHLRSLKAVLGRLLDDGDPRPRFRVPAESLRRALAVVPVGSKEPTCITPEDAKSFLGTALRQDPLVFRWAAVLMLTGCRLGEAERLRWDDVDLDRGTLLIRAAKTGRERRLPLEMKGVRPVSPGLVRLLRRWKLRAGADEYLLGRQGNNALPRLPRARWDRVSSSSGVSVRPKHLRSTWTSYMVRIGWPADVVRLMSGHSRQVQEAHYLTHALRVTEGGSIEEALGAARTIEFALRDGVAVSA